MTTDDPGEHVLSDAEIEAGRKLFAGEAVFVFGAAAGGALPDSGVAPRPESGPESGPASGLPEIAFAGRSNVGKSSLINALTNRKALARTSNTPGRTQQINFFDLAGKLMLVDLPGYGYARASRAAIDEWTELVRRYLADRAGLRRVCLLIDGRHGLKPTDLEMMDMLDMAAVTYQIICTKVDKVSDAARVELSRTIEAELEPRPAARPEVILTSAKKGGGIAELRARLAALSREG